MKKINIVRKKYDFDSVIKNGSMLKNDCFILYYRENNLNKYRFGISVGKKLGNAVFRNKYKRKIRNIIDNNKKIYENNFDYIIIMRKTCINVDFERMNKKFISIFESINKKGESNENSK